jgi:hypothetical protein
MKENYFFAFFVLLISASQASAPEFEVTEVMTSTLASTSANMRIEVQAGCNLVNLSRLTCLINSQYSGSGRQTAMDFFLNPKAKVATLTVNGATCGQERRGSTQQPHSGFHRHYFSHHDGS